MSVTQEPPTLKGGTPGGSGGTDKEPGALLLILLASKVQGLGQLELWVVGAQNGAGKKMDWDSTCLFLPPAPLRMCPAGWKLLAMLALVLVVMVWYSISREDRYIEL